MSKAKEQNLSIDELATFCKRKGFVFKSSEIYGGFSGFWGYGPLGAELFKNLKSDFWKFFVHQKENMVGIEASVISHPKTWKASGHLASFSDVAVICKKCKKATKIDKNEADKYRCECGGEYAVQGEFNLMFKTSVGALNPAEAYLRGETAQAMFLDFKLVQESARKKLPFGIVQVGRCFRNEIAPRDFIFRSREFTIGEFEFFIHPEEIKCELLDTNIGQMVKDKKLDAWHAYWLSEQILWFERLGIAKRIKIREHMKSELSHYSSETFDIDYEYPFGSKEIAGNANRGQYDLMQHAKESGEKFEIFDEATKKRVIPRVIEPTFGMDRIFLALICEGYYQDSKRENIVLKLPASLAPIKAALLPLIAKGEGLELARKIYAELQEYFAVSFDESGSIGKRYARNDEIGTPLCITIDEESPKDKCVTIRDRDTTEQVRVSIAELRDIIKEVINGKSVLVFGKKAQTRVK